MSCPQWEERIVLAACGDATAAEARLAEAHAAECAGCQELLHEMRESLELLRQAHAEPVEEAHYAAVRARVLSRLQPRGWRPWWVWALAAAALVILLIALRPKPARHGAVVPQVAHVVIPSAVEHVLAGGAGPRPPVRAMRHRRVAALATVPPAPPPSALAPAESITIKLITDDPDVVIYWIPDGKGD